MQDINTFVIINSLLSIPKDKRDMKWINDVCTTSRFIHLDVWRMALSSEFVNSRIIPLLREAKEELTLKLHSKNITKSEKEAINIYRKNLNSRIENIVKQYLRGLPSSFAPDSILREINLDVLYEDREEPKQLVEIAHIATNELIKYLKKHPEALEKIKPRQFEELIAEILASYGWDVQLTPPIKDGGYDIFAISKDIEAGVSSSWIIECKKYQKQNKVGVDIVRALYGVKSNLKVANALIATTSYFTKGAKDFKESRYDIEFKDYHDIIEWINNYKPNPHGKLYIENSKLVLPNVK